MSFSPVPQFSFRNITDIAPGFLGKLGVKFLMLDLDNTIASYSKQTPTDHVKRWAASMVEGGVELFIVSNSRREGRVEAFAEAMGVSFIKAARKPSPAGLLRAMNTAGYSKKESALVGDQVYTDALAANRAGIVSMVVRPLSIKNPLIAIRYIFETPFRAAVRNIAANQ